MAKPMTGPPKRQSGTAWNRWLHERMSWPGEGRNANGICRCGAVREIHGFMPDDPYGARPEWGGRGEDVCDLYEFAVREPADWFQRTYGPRDFEIPNGTRVEYVGPVAAFRRDGERFGRLTLDNSDDRSDEYKFGPGSYKAYYVQWDSGRIHHVAHCDLRIVDDSR